MVAVVGGAGPETVGAVVAECKRNGMWPLSAGNRIHVVPPCNTPDELARDGLAILDAAYRVRRHHHGGEVRLNYLINAKSGLCPEDCTYCTQSKDSTAEIEQYQAVLAKNSLKPSSLKKGIASFRMK